MDKLKYIPEDSTVQLVYEYEHNSERKKANNFSEKDLRLIIQHYFFQKKYLKIKKTLKYSLNLYPESYELLLLQASYLVFYDNNIDKALKVAYLADDISKNNPNTFLILGNIYKELNDIDKAVNYFKNAFNLFDTFPEKFMTCEILIDIFLTQNKFKDAINITEKLIGMSEYSDEEIFLIIAELYMKSGNNKKSISYIRKALTLNKKNSVGWFQLASNFFQIKKYEDCIISLEKAIKLDNKFYEAYSLLARTKFFQHKYKEAIVILNKSIKLGDKSAEVYTDLGFCYTNLFEHKKALQYFQKALEIDNNAFLNMLVGQCLFINGYEKESLAFFRKAYELDPDNFEFLELLAKNEYIHQNFIEAAKLFKIITNKNKATYLNWLDYSDCFMQLDCPDEAINTLKQGISKIENQKNEILNYDIAEMYYRLCAYYYKTAQKKQALTTLEIALELDPDGIETLFDYFPEMEFISEIIDLIDQYND